MGSKLAGNAELWNNAGTLISRTEFGSSGFSALPGGLCGNDGIFDGIGSYGLWWSSTEDSSSSAWDRLINYSFYTVHRGSNHKMKGFSVRCVRE